MKSAAFFLPLLLLLPSPAGAQLGPPSLPNPNPYSSFSPPMAVIVVALVAALFFIVFFSIYVRHFSASSTASGRAPGAFSFRWPAASHGLDASVIESFPTFPYSEVKDHRIGKASDLECAVCLSEFTGDETLRLLPTCDHVFHPECIDAWLASHVTCPVCRADLSPMPPQAAAAADDPLPESTPVPGDVFVQVVDDNDRLPPPAKRSWSIRMPKVGAIGKFRSHSTGHSPGEDLERFTLRLPDRVRKDVLDRASLNRTGSLAAAVPRSSSRARSYKKVERDGRSSDRWSFLTRGASTRSPKSAVDGGSGKAPVIAKMPSLKCLEPKTAEDETGLVSQDSASHPV